MIRSRGCCDRNHVTQRQVGAEEVNSAQSGPCNAGRSRRHGQKDHEDLKLRFRRSHRTRDLAGRQVTHKLARSSKTRMVSLLKQITSPVEWNVEKSKDVLSFSNTIIGWNSSQSMMRSVMKNHCKSHRHSCSSRRQRQS